MMLKGAFVIIQNIFSLRMTENNQYYIKHSKCINLTSDFLLVIIIVTWSEELSKDKSRYIDFLHFVLHHRNTLPIIPYTDGVVFTKRNKNIHKRLICQLVAVVELLCILIS